jgi:hypothetical protein
MRHLIHYPYSPTFQSTETSLSKWSVLAYPAV